MLKRYRAPVQSVGFADAKVSTKVQLFRTGNFFNHESGDFKVTTEFLSELLKNFKAGIRGVDLAIDYSHENWGESAGWIKDLLLEDGGSTLWAVVEWTPEGERRLQEKRYRYLSPEFTTEYIDNESLKNVGPMLLGAGLTNRPFIKNMDPVTELQEGTAPSKIHEKHVKPSVTLRAKTKTEGTKYMDYKAMDPAELDKLSPEELKAKCLELMGQLEQLSKAAGESKKKMDDMEVEKVCAERKATFARMLTEGKVVPAQEDAFVKGDVSKFAELAGNSKLDEKGSGKGPSADAEPKVTNKAEAEERVIALAEALVKEGKISLSDAYQAVMKKNPELSKLIYGR